MCRTSWGKWRGNGLPATLRRAHKTRLGLDKILAVLVSLALVGPAAACASLPDGGGNIPSVTQSVAVTGLPAETTPRAVSTAGGTLYFPAVPKKPCDQSSASLELAASSPSLAAGQAVTLTATLRNTGCLGLGLPQYSLSIEAPQSVLTPTHSSPVVHSLAVAPGEADSAAFVLQGVAAGQAVIRGQASFEVHQGYPGPAYWGGIASPAITVTVK